jgi:hypothetical protein
MILKSTLYLYTVAYYSVKETYYSVKETYLLHEKKRPTTRKISWPVRLYVENFLGD